MATSIDPERYAVATQRFTAFFTELGRIYMEREDVLAQVALALLSREHVLMTGPPGTAKSQIATAVLSRIVDATTGKPSVYARQFTENTVQTDLVGPINFKTLMDTGRTEHFTDEGMLGAVHAFLDEVFDGRDMLLRSALNVLNERELKEGTRTTRGQIECAIMTSNRYLAEVLEGSRETLLAFVDRVGFVSFVPRAFSDPANLSRVLARQVGGVRTPALTGVLTIQDLDILQAAADGVTVSETLCEALVSLLGMLEEEMAAACKADPEFVATRYLSVRTAVRAAKILRAICVYDRIFRDPSRPLEAVQGDFLGLRLHLLLAGPQPEAVAKLILRETDPRERRQLAIVRTEREIFDRCLRKLPPAVSKPPPAPEADKKKRAGDASFAKIRKALAAGTAFTDPTELFEAAKSLAAQTEENSGRSAEAGNLLREVVERLHERSLRAGLTAGGLSDRPPGDVVLELGAMAEQLEAMYGGSRPVARWLRGRAIALIDDAATLSPSSPAKVIEQLLERIIDVDLVATQAEVRLSDVEALANIRERLRAQGADPAGDEPGARWQPAVTRLEDDVAVLWDAAFGQAVANAIAEVPPTQVAAVLSQLGPTFARIDAVAARLTKLTGTPSQLKARVVWPRIATLLAATFRRLEAPDRAGVIDEVDAMLDRLEEAGLRGIVTPSDILRWTAEALLRGDLAPPPIDDTKFDLHGYRQMRVREQRLPLAYTLVEIALHLSPEIASRTPDPNQAAAAVADALAKLPEKLREVIAGADVARIQRSAWYLESWWRAMLGDRDPDPATMPMTEGSRMLGIIARSGLLTVVRDEAALLRYALETRLVSDAMPSHAGLATDLRARIERLDRTIDGFVNTLLRRRVDEAWEAMIPAQPEEPA